MCGQTDCKTGGKETQKNCAKAPPFPLSIYGHQIIEGRSWSGIAGAAIKALSVYTFVLVGGGGRETQQETEREARQGDGEKENDGRHTVLQRQRRREYRDRQESCSNFHS